MTAPTDTEARELAEFYADLEKVALTPLWTITEDLLTATPRPKAKPWLWPAETYRPLAARAVKLVPVERGGERRVLSLVNPGLGGQPYAVGTLWGAVQCLGPGETAPAHRHTPGAIRFVLEGEGVFTTVNGDACDMYAGDLVLTPSWAWHDHQGGGDTGMLWFDGLDLPMVQNLDAIFFEPHPLDSQPVDDRNASERRFAGDPVRFADGALGADPDAPLSPVSSPLLVYRWADVVERLSAMAEADPDVPSVELEYTNPETGAAVLPTLSCHALRVFTGRTSAPRRITGNRVYVVHEGSGHSVIDGQRFDWEKGDMFAVPSWSVAEHHADVRADLFVIGDAPALRAFGLYREASAGTQQVTSVFTPLTGGGA